MKDKQLTEEEVNEKLKLYDDKHYFWRDKILTQLGYSINLFLTISIATLGYLLSEKKNFTTDEFHFDYDIKFSFIGYVISFVLLFCSIIYGCISATSRLYDLRITSHTFRVRKKTVEKFERVLPDESPQNSNNRLASLLQVIFRKGFIRVTNSDYTTYENILLKFNNHRDLTRKFGELTWITHSYQIIFLVIAIVIYGFLILL